MTQQHRDALHRAIHAHRTAREAVKDAARKLAEERDAEAARQVALHGANNPTGKETKGNG